MLSDGERATFRDIQKTLVDDPAFEWSIRLGKTTPSPSRRRRMAARLATFVGLLAVFLIIIGTHGAVLLFIAAAITLGLANHVEKRGQKHTN